MGIIRHGDVLFEEVENFDAKFCPAENVVLAEGEVTGHRHVLKGKLLLAEQDGSRFVKLDKSTMLVHEEHDTLTIPEGTYKVSLQREVDLLGEVRQVMD